MKILKGEKYLCVESVYNRYFTKGKVYQSNEDYVLNDNGNNGISFSEHQTVFQPLSLAKWAIKRTPENADEVNRWANESFEHDEQEFYASKYDYIHSTGIIQVKILDGYTEIDLTTFREITGSGEEKPKQLLGEKEAVHCPTLELAEKVIKILDENGVIANYGLEHYYNNYGEKLCFRNCDGTAFHGDIPFYEKKGYTIIPAEQFIKDNDPKDNDPKIYTIEDVRNGKCAIENDGTVEELKIVIRYIFKEDKASITGRHKLYFSHYNRKSEWLCANKADLPTQSVKLFLKQIEGEKERGYSKGDYIMVKSYPYNEGLPFFGLIKEKQDKQGHFWIHPHSKITEFELSDPICIDPKDIVRISSKEEFDKLTTEEWQPKWGEPIQYKTDYGEWYDSFYVASTLDKESHYVEDADGCYTTATEIRQPIKTFTIDQANQDLAKLYNINPEQVKIEN